MIYSREALEKLSAKVELIHESQFGICDKEKDTRCKFEKFEETLF